MTSLCLGRINAKSFDTLICKPGSRHVAILAAKRGTTVA